MSNIDWGSTKHGHTPSRRVALSPNHVIELRSRERLFGDANYITTCPHHDFASRFCFANQTPEYTMPVIF